MPKETIYGTPSPFVGDENAAGPDERPLIQVRWSREAGDVQIVTRLSGYEVHGPEDEPIPCQYGYYVDLDRRAINDLIRKLRRARDQAFGRDE